MSTPAKPKKHKPISVKQVVHITNVDEFIRGNYNYCFGLFAEISCPNTWIPLQTIDVIVDLDFNELRQKAIDATDHEIEALREEMNKRMSELEDRKRTLLALTYNPNP